MKTQRTAESLTNADRSAFLAKVDRRGPSECWPWQGSLFGNGYGQFRRGKLFAGQAHRFAYYFAHGRAPVGDIDHECHTAACGKTGAACPHRSCANPAHLVDTTHRSNMLRGATTVPGMNAAKTECPRGHDYATHAYVSRTGARQCRLCSAERYRAKRASGARRSRKKAS